jgi:hypothetical protein
MSAVRNSQQHRVRRSLRRLLRVTAKLAWCLAASLALLWIAVIAVWLGIQDVLWPVSLTAEIIGGFFIVTGLTALAGAVLVIARALFLRTRTGSDSQIAWIAAAAAAGLYISVTIVVHSFRYEPGKAQQYGALAVLFLLLAAQTTPRAWPSVAKSVKNVGITLGVLATVAAFWYQSFYLPESSQVGIQYGLSVVSVTASGSGRLVTLDLTIENQSSVVALTLESMVVVSGLTFPKKSVAVSGQSAQQNIDAYVNDLATPPAYSNPANPNIGSSGNPSGVILTVMRPISDDSFLFPNDIDSRYFDVVVPKNSITALDIEINLWYARTTRLTLGARFQPVIVSLQSCPEEEQSSWYIEQSALVRFTRGAQILYSNWCASATDPFTNWNLGSPTRKPETPYEKSQIGADIGVEHSTRNEIFTLPS